MWILKTGSLLLLSFIGILLVKAQEPDGYASIEDVPHIVKILFDGKVKCAGNILDYLWVVTAATCVYGYGNEPSRFKIQGSTDLRSEAYGEIREVDKIIRPNNYDTGTLSNDIAMIKLKTAVPMNGYSQPIPLCTQVVPVGANVRVSGWDDTTGIGPSPRLRTVNLKKIAHAKCKSMYGPLGREITYTMTCTAVPDENRCYGNAGSGMVYNHQLCGLVSWRAGCAIKEEPNVFTDILVVKPFIERVMANH